MHLSPISSSPLYNSFASSSSQQSSDDEFQNLSEKQLSPISVSLELLYSLDCESFQDIDNEILSCDYSPGRMEKSTKKTSDVSHLINTSSTNLKIQPQVLCISLITSPRIEITLTESNELNHKPEYSRKIKRCTDDKVIKSQIATTKFLSEEEALNPLLNTERTKKALLRTRSACTADIPPKKFTISHEASSVAEKRKAYTRGKSESSLKTNSSPSVKDLSFQVLKPVIFSYIENPVEDEEKSNRFDRLMRLVDKIAMEKHDDDFIARWNTHEIPDYDPSAIKIEKRALLPADPLYKGWHDCFDLLISHGIENKASTFYTKTLHEALKILIRLKPLEDSENVCVEKGVMIKDILSLITELELRKYNPLEIVGQSKVIKLNKKIKQVVDRTFNNAKNQKLIIKALLKGNDAPLLSKDMEKKVRFNDEIS
ncbi:MAG TPA: hypothetical protein VGP47_04780 [Parachlamydiaceae bacterium]|nr:hypothetical protein [Parachlamydiaceae bacterium]